jgi:hypothetical protein
MTVPYGWQGSLSTSSAAYNLTEDPSVTFTSPVTTNQIQNYTAALKTFTISGSITGILPSNSYPITVSATTTNNPTYGVYQSYPNIVATNGTYSISVPYGWQGNITATSVAYNLTPASITVAPVTANLSGQDFAATLKTFTVSGDIFDIIPGTNYPITITANCSNPLLPWYDNVTNIDASSGHYDFTLPYGWEGSLSIDSPAYNLKEEPNVTFNSPVTSDQIQNYIVIELKTFTVSGTIKFDISQPNIFPITIKAECSNPMKPWYEDVFADATGGYYTMALPYGWEGILVPESAAYTLIEDPGITFTTPITSDQVQDYLAKINMFTISGHTYLDGLGNKPIEGVTLQAKGTGVWANYTAKELSNSEGDYTVDVPYAFSGLVVPSKEGYEFTPKNREYDNVTANIDNQDYIGFANYVSPPVSYTISGYVTQLGAGIQGVAIVDNTNKIVAYTNAQGYYSFEKQPGWTGTARAVKSPYKFSPASYSYTKLSGNQTNKNYIRVQ